MQGTITRQLRGNFFRFSKHREVDMAVRILLKHGATERVGPHRTTAMTKREIVTFNAILRNDRCRPLEEFLTGAALFQHHAQTLTFKNVAKEIFRIARYPAVTLSDITPRVY